MPAIDPALLQLRLPDDFHERSTAINIRLEAGEPMTIEYIADQLGMPFELFAAACALYAAAVYDVLVEIDGYLTDDDERLSHLGSVLRRPVVIGSYASPIGGAA